MVKDRKFYMNKFFCFSRKILYILIAISILFSFQINQPIPVFAAVDMDESLVTPLFENSINYETLPNHLQVTPTPPANLSEDSPSFNPKSVSITLIFDTIIKWLFGKNLIDIFKEAELTEEQQKQIELLTGEKNPVSLINNFCEQYRSGDFSRMAESIKESNPDENNGTLSPAILMDFFENLGAFCPAE